MNSNIKKFLLQAAFVYCVIGAIAATGAGVYAIVMPESAWHIRLLSLAFTPIIALAFIQAAYWILDKIDGVGKEF